MATPFPRGMGIRRAGPAPVMQQQGNIYGDLGKVAQDVGQGVQEYQQSEQKESTRQAMMEDMIRKRQLAQEVHDSKLKMDTLNYEIAQEEQSDLQGSKERKEAFYDSVSGLDPLSPEYKKNMESALFKHQQVDPQKFYDEKFGKSKTQGPKAEIYIGEDGKPYQISKVYGETTMVPVTMEGGKDAPTKFVSPKNAQVVYGEGGKAYTLSPGETVAQPLEKTEGGQLTKERINPKLRLEIKGKINKIQVARNQLAEVRRSFHPGTISFGPAQGYLPSEQGQMFDQAVNALRTTFRTLTRTPGEGSMSDMETRLAQAALPDRTKYEAVTQQQIDALDEMLDFLEKGYNTDEFVGEAPESQSLEQPQPNEQAPQDLNDPLGIKSGGKVEYSNDPLGLHN